MNSAVQLTVDAAAALHGGRRPGRSRARPAPPIWCSRRCRQPFKIRSPTWHSARPRRFHPAAAAGRSMPVLMGSSSAKASPPLVLKRKADAERDGDRIYAVIKGVGASSDGRARGIDGPGRGRTDARLERAYKKAGISPSSVGYVEAHGTAPLWRRGRDRGARSAVSRMPKRAPGDCVVGSSSLRSATPSAPPAGRAHQCLAESLSQGPAADDRHRKSEPKLDLREGPFRFATRRSR